MRNWMASLFLAVAMIGCSGETETAKVEDTKKVDLKPTQKNIPVVDENTPPAPETLAADHNPALLDPSLATATAPDTYKVKFETTNGAFVLQINRAWAPLGAGVRIRFTVTTTTRCIYCVIIACVRT